MIANWIRPVRMGEHRQPWATGPSTRSESMSSEYPPIFTTRGPAYCLDRAAAVQTAVALESLAGDRPEASSPKRRRAPWKTPGRSGQPAADTLPKPNCSVKSRGLGPTERGLVWKRERDGS